MHFSERHTEKLHLSKTQRKQRTRKGRVGAVSTVAERSGETEGKGSGSFRKKECSLCPVLLKCQVEQELLCVHWIQREE